MAFTIIDELVHVLNYLINDIEDGLLVSLENAAKAESFEDFLDHAELYLEDNRKDPAGAIAGVVFEDTIRRLCRLYGIIDNGRSCDDLINAIKSNGKMTSIESKEAKVCADVRAKATHALWNEFNKSQVETTIKFTRRLIRDRLI